MDRSSKYRINKETTDLNNTIEQMELTNIHRTFYQPAVEYIFFSRDYESFTKLDYMLANKTSLNKLMKTNNSKYLFQTQWKKTRNQ